MYKIKYEEFDEHLDLVFILSIISPYVQASKALKLCCSASWTCVRQFCQMLDDKSRPTDSEFSENTVLSFVNEVITRSAFLIDMLYQRDMHKVERAMSEILKSWSMGATLFNGLPVPVQLVKQWVKVSSKVIQFIRPLHIFRRC